MLLNRYKEARRSSIILLKRLYTSELLDYEKVTPVKLSYSTYETQTTDSNCPPLVVVHGYLASKRNWVTPCKKLLQQTNPQRKIIAVDLRNHGESPHSSEHSNYHIVRDMRHFINGFPFKQVAMMGHSYGGLVSMLYALLYPDKVQKLIIVDIVPKDQTKNFEHIRHVLNAVTQVTMPSKVPMSVARSLIDEQLKRNIPENEYRSILLTQLIQKEEGMITWRFNIDVLKENAINTGSFPEIIGKVFEKPTIFIGGERSHFLKKDDEADTKRYFPSAEFHYVPGAGHLVHADRPQEFIKICVNFLNEWDSSDTVELLD